MNYRSPIACLLLISILAAPGTFAGDIFKWVDENGTVHFGDRPPEDNSTEDDVEEPFDQPLVESSIESQPTAENTDPGAAVNSPSAEQPEQANEQRCTRLRMRLRELLTSRQLLREEKNGNRVPMTESEISAARESAQEGIVEHCNRTIAPDETF